jgi:hypothetical protein
VDDYMEGADDDGGDEYYWIISVSKIIVFV